MHSGRTPCARHREHGVAGQHDERERAAHLERRLDQGVGRIVARRSRA
jgi:hypothetical protein